MSATTTHYKEIYEILGMVKNIYRNGLELEWEKKERYVLEFLKGITEKNELFHVSEACEKVLLRFPEGSYPHDTTLMQETISLVRIPYKRLIPVDSFDMEMIWFKMVNALIKEQFDKIYAFPLDRKDKVLIDSLWKGVHCTFVDNPNLKGAFPYHKKYPNDFIRSKKQSLEFLDEDFNGYMAYFKDEEQEKQKVPQGGYIDAGQNE